MRCTVAGCPGDYEQRWVIHTVRHEGRVVVIDHVPAETCPICGDVLLRPETVRSLEKLLAGLGQPDATVPLYEFA